jgi:hypothetical protein
MEKVEYISLGSDCSVAYQLGRNGLRRNAYPFDWIRINGLEDIEKLIDTNFQYFFEPEYLVKERESTNFHYIEDDWTDYIDPTCINIILKHKLYNITYPHDIRAINYETDMLSAIEKYKRRIIRFYEILKDDAIKKVFIRTTQKKENIDELDKILKKYTKNYEIRLIVLDKLSLSKCTEWKKTELDWEKYFLI